MAYHYTESGLDNVFLVDGFKIHKTKYGRGVSIERTEDLHQTIGRWLVNQPKTFNGAELRFLRLEMDFSQKHLAALIKSTEQNVRRWEKTRNRNVPGPADFAVRTIYKDYIRGGSRRRMFDRIPEDSVKLDQAKRVKAQFRETRSGWEVERPTPSAP